MDLLSANRPTPTIEVQYSLVEAARSCIFRAPTQVGEETEQQTLHCLITMKKGGPAENPWTSRPNIRVFSVNFD